MLTFVRPRWLTLSALSKLSLKNYPDFEFGAIKGQVSKISLTADDDDFYHIYVSLPQKLVSNYKFNIPFQPEMQANAEIITNKTRLLERFIYRWKTIFS